MSRQLKISASLSVVAMAAFALLSAVHAPLPASATGAQAEAHAPAISFVNPLD